MIKSLSIARPMYIYNVSTMVRFRSYVGFRKPPYEHPVRTNQIPRQVPEQAWYLHPIFW